MIEIDIPGGDLLALWSGTLTAVQPFLGPVEPKIMFGKRDAAVLRERGLWDDRTMEVYPDNPGATLTLAGNFGPNRAARRAAAKSGGSRA